MKTESVYHFTHYKKYIYGLSIGMMLHDIVMLYQDLKKIIQCSFIKKKITQKQESIDVEKVNYGILKKIIENNFIIKPVFY